MVVNAPISGKGPVKRSLSSMQDGCAGWDDVSPTRASMCSPFNLPFDHYAVIYYDNMGKINVSESLSIQGQGRSIFTPDVRERFLDIIGPKIGYNKPLMRPVPHAYKHAHDVAHQRHGKRRKASLRDPALAMSFSENFPEPVPQIPSPLRNNMVSMQIGDTDKVMEYYETAFKNFQQKNCRTVAKAFIKAIQPRKQVDFPYNGKPKKSNGPIPREAYDPEKTKPDWWPAEIQHREPDHLKKDQRLRLLIHILRKLEPINFSAETLQEIAQDSKRLLEPEENREEKWELLNEIFKVRKLEERFEHGEVDANTIVYIRSHDAPAKDVPDNESVVSDTEPKLELDDLEDVEEDPLVFATSSHPLSSSFASVDPLALQARSFSMSSERNQSFTMNESLSFDESSTPTRPFYHTTAEYSDEYSHPIMKPEASGLVSPHEHPNAFDYLSSAPFTAPAVSEHHRPMALPMHQTSHLDNWYQAYRPNAYNPMEYVHSQTLSQNPMHYAMPAHPLHPHDIPHGLPDMARERSSHMGLMTARNSVSKSF
ncbi:hypothetical protein BJX70DRAFT_252310 [Aspergillus crustosus]